jgi:predicted dehydrogenase
VTTMRAGLSGCHAASAALVRNSRLSSVCDVVAAHDDDPAALRTFCERAPIGAPCATFDALLATGVDFVVLAGRPDRRLEHVQAAAAQAVPCLVMEPFASDLATATAMVRACDEAQVKLGVVVPGFDDPLLDQLRRMIAQDWLGGISCVQAIAGDDHGLHGDRLPRPHPFLELTARQLHLTSWLVGRSAVRVTAQATKSFGAHDDAAAATAVLRGGVVASFVATHLANASAYAVHGTDGGFRLAGDRLWLLGRREFHGPVFDYTTPGQERVLSRAALLADPAHAAAHEPLARFALWLEECDDFPCPAEQALEDLRVVDALLRAVRSGRAEDV